MKRPSEFSGGLYSKKYFPICKIFGCISGKTALPHRLTYANSSCSALYIFLTIYPQNLYISLPQKESISSQTPISIYIDHKLHKKQSGGRL